MTFDDYAQQSVTPFRVLVELASPDGSSYSAYYSTSNFTPIGSAVPYEGRLAGLPSVSIKRDSTFHGILLYSFGDVSLYNADGALDTLCENNLVTGGTVRVKVGFDPLALSSYSTIFTGYAGNITIAEDLVNISIDDLRKKLGQKNYVSHLQTNAVTFVQDILTETYGITYDDTYFDTTAWEAARSAVSNISRYHPEDDTVDKAISDIVGSTFGFFTVTGDGLYSYKVIDTSASSVTTIQHADIINHHSIAYGADEILATARARSPKWGAWADERDVGAGVTFVYCLADLTICQLAGTGPNGQVYKTDDDGASWALLQQLGSDPLVFSIAVTGSDAAIAGTGYPYGLGGTGNVYRTQDAGSSWTLIGALGSSASVLGLAYLGSSTVIAGTGSSAASIYRSLDSGSSFSLVRDLTGETSVMCVSSLGSGRTVVGTYPSAEIWRSTDYGSSWTLVTIVAGHTKVDAFAYLGSGIVVAAVGGAGSYAEIYRSSDYGSSWSLMETFDSHTYNQAYSLAQVDDGVVFFGTGNWGEVYKSEDYGSSWTIIQRLGLEQQILALLPLGSGKILGGTSPNGKVFISKFADIFEWQEDSSHQASTISVYGVDANKDFETFFSNDADALTFAQTAEDYFKDQHGKLSVEVPIRYYDVGLGDNVDVEVWRSQSAMLGTKKCEVMGKTWNLARPSITFNLRIV